MDALERIRDLGYRWGDQQAILYDPARVDVFPGLYLSNLWHDCKNSGRRRSGNGILEPLFCGMARIDHDAIIAYLTTRKLYILGEWRQRIIKADEPPRVDFIPLGFCFLTTGCQGKSGNSAFGAYAFFESAWRTPQQIVLTHLGIAALICEENLLSLHGIRYSDNHLTARWMAQFGFRDIGVIPNYMIRYSTGELTDATISTLNRETFEALLGRATAVDGG